MKNALGLETPFSTASGKNGRLVSLPELERRGFGPVSRLPVSLRIVLESLARNVDGERVTEEDVRALAGWAPRAERSREIPFLVGRVLLQDFTGVPLLADLAAMRSAVARLGKDPASVEPIVPVDLVVDHSVQVDAAGTSEALGFNTRLEMERNRARYEFLRWGTQAFKKLRIVPPGVGICHQVNLEYLSRGVLEEDGVSFPDTLVGTDSHTPMVNGLGLLAWGVGGSRPRPPCSDSRSTSSPPTWWECTCGVHCAPGSPRPTSCSGSRSGCARPRWWASSSSSSARGRDAAGAGARHPLQHGPRVRCHRRLPPPDAQSVRYLEQTGAPRGGGGLPRLQPRPGNAPHPPPPARWTTPRWSSSTSPPLPPFGGRPEATAGRTTCPPSARPSASSSRARTPAATGSRPLPRPLATRFPARRPTWGTATCSSQPSPPAPIRPTPASCWPRDCWPERPSLAGSPSDGP